MPIECPNGQKPRYRWKGNVRLAFCGNKVVETKKKGGEAKSSSSSNPAKKSKKYKVLYRK